MSCFHCSLAGWTGRRRQTISPETSPHGQLCFGGSQAHAKKCKPNCLTFLATQTLVPPLSLCFVCFPQFLLSVSGGFSSIVGLGEPEQGQHQLLQGASIGIKSQHWEQGSVPAVTYTFPGPSCSRCAHKSSLWRCLGQIHLRIHWHILPPQRHCSFSVQAQPSQRGDIPVSLLQLLPLIPAHPKCLPW